jgi:hypothetical protein
VGLKRWRTRLGGAVGRSGQREKRRNKFDISLFRSVNSGIVVGVCCVLLEIWEASGRPESEKKGKRERWFVPSSDLAPLSSPFLLVPSLLKTEPSVKMGIATTAAQVVLALFGALATSVVLNVLWQLVRLLVLPLLSTQVRV